MSTRPILYTYCRSSCSYRVRIALNIKQIDCEYRFVNLKPTVNEQRGEAYRNLNPQGRVPLFIDGDVQITQSPAILEYLDEKYPETPLLPKDLIEKTQCRQLCNTIACDIQPLNNTSVIQHLKNMKVEQEKINYWYAYWIQQGFNSIEPVLQKYSQFGHFSSGEEISMVDVFLVPQVYNALRFNVSIEDFPRIKSVYKHCLHLTAILAASPEKQHDYVD